MGGNAIALKALGRPYSMPDLKCSAERELGDQYCKGENCADDSKDAAPCKEVGARHSPENEAAHAEAFG